MYQLFNCFRYFSQCFRIGQVPATGPSAPGGSEASVSFRAIQGRSGQLPRVTVIGTGYLGLTHAVCLADLGHEVLAIDVDAEKIAQAARGEAPDKAAAAEHWYRHELLAEILAGFGRSPRCPDHPAPPALTWNPGTRNPRPSGLPACPHLRNHAH